MATKTATAKLNVKELLTAAGYTISTFTSDECAAIFDKVAELVTIGRSAAEALQVAVSTCTPSKAKALATGTFEADGVKIRGGAYHWVDTKDGYFTLLDVPLVSAYVATRRATAPRCRQVAACVRWKECER